MGGSSEGKPYRLLDIIVGSATIHLSTLLHKMDFDQLKRDFRWLRGEDGVAPAREAVRVLGRILTPLLAAEGFSVIRPKEGDLEVDLYASPRGYFTEPGKYRTSIAIEYRHFGNGKPLDADAVNRLIANIGFERWGRAMLIGRFGFTKAAAEAARSREPVNVELVDLSGIDAWIRRLEIGKPDYSHKVQVLIKSISHEFAKLVSESPSALDDLEWRDLERMMARIMEGLGFHCKLTPSSKDGGKDLILIWRAACGDQSFVVELKHWRSAKRVGKTAVSHFMNVIVAENRTGGLLLSTSGYSTDRAEGITEITRNRLRLGGKSKVVLLAKTYIRAFDGLWSAPSLLPEVLFEATETP